MGLGRPPPQLSPATLPQRPDVWWPASLTAGSWPWMDKRSLRPSPPGASFLPSLYMLMSNWAQAGGQGPWGQPLWGLGRAGPQTPGAGVTELPGCPGKPAGPQPRLPLWAAMPGARSVARPPSRADPGSPLGTVCVLKLGVQDTHQRSRAGPCYTPVGFFFSPTCWSLWSKR